MDVPAGQKYDGASTHGPGAHSLWGSPGSEFQVGVTRRRAALLGFKHCPGSLLPTLATLRAWIGGGLRLRVPATAYGRPCAAAAVATIAWVPSPPAETASDELLHIITPIQFHGLDPARGGPFGQSDFGSCAGDPSLSWVLLRGCHCAGSRTGGPGRQLHGRAGVSGGCAQRSRARGRDCAHLPPKIRQPPQNVGHPCRAACMSMLPIRAMQPLNGVIGGRPSVLTHTPARLPSVPPRLSSALAACCSGRRTGPANPLTSASRRPPPSDAVELSDLRPDLLT